MKCFILMILVMSNLFSNDSLISRDEGIILTEPQDQKLLSKVLKKLDFYPSSNLTIKLMKGGSTDSLYHILAGHQEFVVRISHQGFEPHLVPCTQFAADQGLGPPVIYRDNNARILVTGFVQGTSLFPQHLENPELIKPLALGLKTLHGSDLNLPDFNPLEKIYKQLEIFNREPSFKDISQKISDIESLFAQFPQVPCHNDLHFGNLLLGNHGKIQWIDWGDAGLSDPYFDLGRIAIEYGLTDEQSKLFLTTYLGRAPNSVEEARFYLSRQIFLVRVGLAFLKSGDRIDDQVLELLRYCAKNQILKIPGNAQINASLSSKEVANWAFNTFLENSRSEAFSQATEILSQEFAK